MYSTEISINGKIIPIRFGAYVIKCLSDDGIKLAELSEQIQDNPASVIPSIFYYGAVNASKERKGEGISINDIYDWLDIVEGGLFGEETMKVVTLFTKQLSDGVPKQKTTSKKK